MRVPFLDLKKQYLNIKEEIDETIKNTIEDSAFIMGERVSNFEKNFANFCEIKHTVGVSNGTSALHLSMLSMGLKKGDEVITVPNTFVATIQHINHLGANVKFVDIDPETYLIDLSKLEETITDKTKIIIPVHLYGQMCNMKKIKEIAEKYNIKILEDAAQAHGAEFDGKKPGFYGDIAVYSFYPGKNLGAYGDAGAVTTNNEDYALKISQLRNHGRLIGEKYLHAVPGFNERIDALQAAIISVKLKYLKKWNEMRRNNAKLYSDLLNDSNVIFPKEHEKAKAVYHLYVIKTKQRDKLQSFLKSNNIDTGIHYPVPLHLQPAYKHLNMNEGRFPTAEKVSQEILSLPIYPELSEEQIRYVVNKIKEFHKS